MIKLDYPTFELTVPSTKTKITYRPFLVKEEKILLMAQQSENVNDIMRAIKDIIKACLITKVDVDKLTLFDIEYIFLKLRANSVNNIINLTYRDKDDGKNYTFEVDLNEVEVEFDPNHTDTIKLNETTKLVLSYPGTILPERVINAKDENEAFFELIKSCLFYCYNDEEKFEFKDATEEERNEFLNNLPIPVFEEIRKFFDTMPKLRHRLKYTNNTPEDKEIVLETLNDFFTLR